MSSASKACSPAGRRAAALILMKVMWPPLGSASLRRSSPKQADADATPRVPHLLPVGISNEIEIELSQVEPDTSISSVAHLTPMRPTVAHTVRSASGQPCSKTLGGNRVMRSAENRHRERSILAALIPVDLWMGAQRRFGFFARTFFGLCGCAFTLALVGSFSRSRLIWLRSVAI